MSTGDSARCVINRDAAIEAGAKAVDPLAWEGTWSNAEHQALARRWSLRRATDVIDAAIDACERVRETK